MNHKELKSNIESLLFISSRPIDKKEIAKNMGRKINELEGIFKELVKEYNDSSRGINIVSNGQSLQMVTNPENSEYVQKFLKTEVSQELTPASLETLSIIAYCGPLTKADLEKIRGINCNIIIRHLLIKGLITEKVVNKAHTKDDGKETIEKQIDSNNNIYSVSLDFIKHLGINDVQELPDYEKLNNKHLNKE